MKDIIDKDLGYKKIFMEMGYFARRGGPAVKVGIQGPEAEMVHENADGLTNVKLGLTHEYGSKAMKIPERSHWRAVFDENSRRYLEQITKAVATFKSANELIGEIRMVGEEYKTDVLMFLKAGVPGNPGGKVRHLHQTGQYWNSFSAVMDWLAG